ncbi:hypothetical protein ACHAW5_000776 [Stephanodiscus triporus]|uniref:Uncharacterized protein n=1 Tax=Stephanodiscus triporus TaxID=2934178 RepID=A0ABD3QM31_9STRA
MTRPMLRFDPSRHRRQATSFLATSSSSPVTPPKPGSTWERGAKLVKDTDVTNPYLDRVRSEVVDPALQIKTIEDELCAAIGKALGKQGEKVQFALREMKEARAQYLECIHAQAYEGAMESARHHNDARKRAIKARWELLVHRQAVGFTVDNHSVVHKTFPIGEALPEKMEDIRTTVSKDLGDSMNVDAVSDQPPKKAWGDQLSWWERVGRWK